MIDICFGDSECGLLKYALDKNDVLHGYSLLDLGRLAAPDLLSARKEWIEGFFSGCSKRERHRIFMDEKKQVESIMQRAKVGENPRIWIASCPRSRCGFFHLVHDLQDIAEIIYVVEMPDDTGYLQNGMDRCWGEADPFMIDECLPLQRALSTEERKHFAACWETLVAENAELRVNENGTIKSVPIDYLDDEIYSFAPEGEVKLLKVAGEMIGRSKHIITDSFVYDRIDAMIEEGRFELVKKAAPDADYYRDTILKKAI